MSCGCGSRTLFDVRSARAGRGDQAETDGLANAAVLFLQENPRLPQDPLLFAFVLVHTLFSPGAFVPRRMNGSLGFILLSDRGPCGLPLNTGMSRPLICRVGPIATTQMC